MRRIAYLMLTGDTTRFFGIVAGIMFASLLLTQQLSTFSNIMTQTYSGITSVGSQMWVMDPAVRYIDDNKPMTDNQLARVRSVSGVLWAMPLYKGNLSSRLEDGQFVGVTLYGLDGTTLIGGPGTMLAGKLEDLRRSGAVVVDETSARDELAHPGERGRKIPLAVGDTLEINDHRAVVVGICKVARGFQSQPVVYTTYQRALEFAPAQRKSLTYILAAPQPGSDPHEVDASIRKATGLEALTASEFIRRSLLYFITKTGIVIGFGMSVAVAFLVGTLIAGQTFYNFTLENLRHFGALKAMGATNKVLVGMVALQASLVGALGFGMGSGLAALLGVFLRHSKVGYLLPWQVVAFTATAVMVICILASVLSVRKIICLEPGIVFKA